MKALDLTGKRFGRLIAVKRSENIKGKCAWICRCDCGSELVVTTNHLRTGNTQSCGCYQKEQTSAARRKSGLSRSSIYRRWDHMKSRCLNPNDAVYRHYGGRGIKVCDEWLNSFEAFYGHVSQLPHFGEKGYSLDRINNNGNYEPGNVRWATQSEQVKNQRPRMRRKTTCS